MTMTAGSGPAVRTVAARIRVSGRCVSRPALTALESCNLPAPVAQSIFRKQNFWRMEKKFADLKALGARLVNWTEPEYPQSLLQVYDPPGAVRE
jgi:predicted Rossmann fold nucleotide-binding protein DprA/Smf involved in DNA uptake